MFTEITYNDQSIGLYFGLPAIAEISKDIDLMQGQNEIGLNLGAIVSILKAGYDNNCLIERIRPAITYKDFYLFVEQSVLPGSVPPEIQEAVNVFSKSKLVTVKSENGIEKKMPV